MPAWVRIAPYVWAFLLKWAGCDNNLETEYLLRTSFSGVYKEVHKISVLCILGSVVILVPGPARQRPENVTHTPHVAQRPKDITLEFGGEKVMLLSLLETGEATLEIDGVFFSFPSQ